MAFAHLATSALREGAVAIAAPSRRSRASAKSLTMMCAASLEAMTGSAWFASQT